VSSLVGLVGGAVSQVEVEVRCGVPHDRRWQKPERGEELLSWFEAFVDYALQERGPQTIHEVHFYNPYHVRMLTPSVHLALHHAVCL